MKSWDGRPNFGTVAQKQGREALADADWAEFERKARVVETARRLYGKGAARRLWRDLGLPALRDEASTAPDPRLLAQVAAFIASDVVLDPDARLRAPDLYAAYVTWAIGSGVGVMTWQMFGRVMNHMAIPKYRRRHTTYGARLASKLPAPLADASGRDGEPCILQ